MLRFDGVAWPIIRGPKKHTEAQCSANLLWPVSFWIPSNLAYCELSPGLNEMSQRHVEKDSWTRSDVVEQLNNDHLLDK